MDILFLCTFSLGLLLYSYTLPFMQTKKFIFFKEEYSLRMSIENMWTEKFYGLAMVIFLFSVFFPILKLLMIYVIWFVPFRDEQRERILYWLGLLGKWSMLDVFVVAILIVMIRAQALMDAKPLPGIYAFASAIVLAMSASFLLERVAGSPKDRNPRS